MFTYISVSRYFRYVELWPKVTSFSSTGKARMNQPKYKKIMKSTYILLLYAQQPYTYNTPTHTCILCPTPTLYIASSSLSSLSAISNQLDNECLLNVVRLPAWCCSTTLSDLNFLLHLSCISTGLFIVPSRPTLICPAYMAYLSLRHILHWRQNKIIRCLLRAHETLITNLSYEKDKEKYLHSQRFVKVCLLVCSVKSLSSWRGSEWRGSDAAPTVVREPPAPPL